MVANFQYIITIKSQYYLTFLQYVLQSQMEWIIVKRTLLSVTCKDWALTPLTAVDRAAYSSR